MKRTITPGRLALYGLVLVVVGAVMSVIFANAFDGDNDGAGFLFQALSVVAYGAGVVLLIGAGIAKAVQIGTRSAND